MGNHKGKEVVVALTIGPDGRPSNAQIVQTSAGLPQAFETWVIRSVLDSVWHPARDEHGTATEGTVRVVFRP